MGDPLKMTKKPNEINRPRTIPPYDWNGVKEAEKRKLARSAALKSQLTEFTARCATHGESLFCAHSGACLNCLAEPSDLLERLRYLNAYAVAYPFTCETHGRVLHYMASNRCTHCFTAAGKPRRQGARNEARLAARASGATSYLATCSIHGEAPHHTVRGKCLSCFNSLGYPRKAFINRVAISRT